MLTEWVLVETRGAVQFSKDEKPDCMQRRGLLHLNSRKLVCLNKNEQSTDRNSQFVQTKSLAEGLESRKLFLCFD